MSNGGLNDCDAAGVAAGFSSAPASACAGAAGGIFITFEGGDGTGKTTHIKRLAQTLKDYGTEVVCVREPGGTKIGEAVRDILLDPQNAQMSSECELLLYEAARAQIVSEVIKPALARGAVVLCDRFADSTLAYQGFGRGLDKAFIQGASAFAQAGVQPDRTILLTCGGANVSLARAIERDVDDAKEAREAQQQQQQQQQKQQQQQQQQQQGARVSHEAPSPTEAIDRMELAGEAFHNKVNEAYLALAQSFPERICVIDSTQSKDETAAKICSNLQDLFPWMEESK